LCSATPKGTSGACPSTEIVWNIRLRDRITLCRVYFCNQQTEETMKRALITIATVGILAPTAWVAGANAQYGSSPPPRPSAASNPSQGYSAQSTSRASRRSARQTPSAATANTPGSGPPPSQAYAQASQGHFTWYASPGPMKRGNECITNVDSTRGYGFRGPCKK